MTQAFVITGNIDVPGPFAPADEEATHHPGLGVLSADSP
jgi:hypothetical protein